MRRRFGYRRIHDLLRPRFPGVNHKRVYRLYRQAHLAVRRRKKGKRPLSERVPLQLARTVNEVWSMDFVSDSLSGGRRLSTSPWPMTSATRVLRSRWTLASQVSTSPGCWTALRCSVGSRLHLHLDGRRLAVPSRGLDLYSRRIVGWSMQESMTLQPVVDALMMAVWRRASR